MRERILSIASDTKSCKTLQTVMCLLCRRWGGRLLVDLPLQHRAARRNGPRQRTAAAAGYLLQGPIAAAAACALYSAKVSQADQLRNTGVGLAPRRLLRSH